VLGGVVLTMLVLGLGAAVDSRAKGTWCESDDPDERGMSYQLSAWNSGGALLLSQPTCGGADAALVGRQEQMQRPHPFGVGLFACAEPLPIELMLRTGDCMRERFAAEFKKRFTVVSDRSSVPVFRDSGRFEFDSGCGGFNFLEVGGGEFDLKRADVLFQAMELGCAGDWNDPRLLREQPGEGNLRGRGVFSAAQFCEQIDHGLVGLQGFRREAGQGTAEVVAGECGALVDLAGEEAFAEWAVGDEADAEFFEGGMISSSGGATTASTRFAAL